jgi:hypothetical protein
MNNSTINSTNVTSLTPESLVKHSGSVWIYLAYTSLLVTLL